MPLVSVDVKAIPTVHTIDFSTLISDSGIIRYRVDAKVYDIYSNTEDPYWHYPDGIYVERFDSLLQVEANIVADTAYYFVRKDLWRAVDNVVVKNMEGTTFETSELFWNPKASPNAMDAFYTNRPVKITKIDGTVIPALNGFKADQSLSIIRLLSVGKGTFMVEESADTLSQNTVSSDNKQLP